MSLIKEVKYLLLKDIKQEWRQRHALNGIVLYLLSALFIIYLSLSVINPPTWNALYWILILFTSVSAVAKSFIQEPGGRLLYFYQLASAQAVIVSKIIYNAILMVILAFLGWALYSLLIGNMATDNVQFGLAVLLGSLGFSSAFTMVSAIASKGSSSHILMPVLSFPIIIPLLLVTIKATSKTIVIGSGISIWEDLGIMLLIDVVIVILSIILFRFLWRD